MKANIFLDCGAPSIYNKLIRHKSSSNYTMGAFIKTRGLGDYSFLETDEYKAYMESYIEFVKKNKKYITVYPNMDVMYNAKATWENQLYLEKRGLNPLPVYHLGSDEKWLKLYIDKGYEYICLGGIIPETAKTIIPILDYIWEKYLIDKRRYPKIKVHGFGITNLKFIWRYPWYSVDSTTWMTGKFGFIIFPYIKNNQYSYRHSPRRISVTHRTKSSKSSIFNLNEQERKKVFEYIKQNGFVFGKSKIIQRDTDYKLSSSELWADKEKGIVEKVIEIGVSNNKHKRDGLNLHFFVNLQKELPKWPFKFESKNKRFGLK